MLDATLLTSPRWTRAPLSCNRCGVPARVDAASRSGTWQYPSTPDPTDIAYFLVVVHLRDGHDSTTLAWLVTSTLRLPSYPRLHLRHGFTAAISTSLPMPPSPLHPRHPALRTSAYCGRYTPVLGVVYLADDYDTPGARSALILAAALSLRVDLHTRASLHFHLDIVLRDCCIDVYIRVNFGLPVDRRDLDPAAEVAAPAVARQTPLARPTPHPTLGPADTHQDARGERKVSFASQVKAEPQTKPPQGQEQMQPPPVPGPAADADDAGDDSFGFFSDDDAFLACVDMGEGDLGQPIDFEEGASSVSVGDEEKAVEAARSLPQPEAKPVEDRYGPMGLGRTGQEWEHRRPKPVFTGETAPSRSNDKSAASVARALAIANHCRPSTSNPNQQAPSEPEGGASTGGASTSALPPQQKRPSTPSVCGFHFPPGMPNPLLQNNGRPPPQGVKRGADAMMSSSTRSGAMGLSTSGSGGSTARQLLGTLVLDPQQQHQQGGSGDEGSSPSAQHINIPWMRPSYPTPHQKNTMVRIVDQDHEGQFNLGYTIDQWDDRWTGILCAICEDAATIIYDQERAKGKHPSPLASLGLENCKVYIGGRLCAEDMRRGANVSGRETKVLFLSGICKERKGFRRRRGRESGHRE
ncbi:hypothetical protein B0H14DRAFT_3645297 [Mycena olivaceomarginata]|nr:hypothetical protein B0H14DRAFT_3645297 [Mycena olivaceomarginata]